MFRNVSRSLLLSLLIVALGAAGLGFQASRAVAAPGDAPVGGQIFVDLDRDGEIGTNELLPDSDSFYPPGGIAVTVYDADGNSVPGVVTSTAAGVSWTADVTGLTGSDFRVEFEIDPADQAAGFTESFLGPDSSSSVTFASAGDTAVSFGVVPPSACSGDSEGYVWTTCFVNGERGSGGPTDVLVGAGYSDLDGGPATAVGEKAEYGSIWGLAYDQWSGTLYTSAFLKRGSDLGPEGLDGVYWSDGVGGPAGSVSLDSLGGTSYGTDPVSRALGEYDNVVVTDEDVFSDIGKTGIGDIDLTPDGRSLMVSNLETKEIDVYDVSGVPTGANPVYVRSIAVTNPGCSNADYAIFAINAVDADTAYVGVTCTAQTSELASDLEAHVVEIDVSGAGTPTSVLSIPLDYERGCAIYNLASTDPACRQNVGVEDGNYQPWTDDPADAQTAGPFPVLSQPMFTDIEIDDDGSLVLGFADRWGHQRGYGGQTGQNVIGGELLHVCNTSGNPASPTWVVEGAAGCPGNFISTTTDPTDPGYHGGPNGPTEFYGEESLIIASGGHLETSNGGLYLRPGSGEVVVSVMDPITTISGGLSVYDTTTGQNTADLQLYRGVASSGYLGKSAGIGDVEGCFVPVGLGDRVWLDLDNNGVQDPGELALAGVTVIVSGGSLSAPLTVTTDANGQWELTGLDGLLPGESYTIEIDPSTVTNLPAGLTVADLFATIQDAALGSDVNDSDIDSGTLIMTTAPLEVGEVNHTYDAGFSADVYDLALTKVYTSDSFEQPADGIVEDGADATFTITVTNQGTVDATTFEVTDYIPAGFVLNDGAWSDNGDGTATISGGPLAAGATQDITITLTVNGANDGDHVNWAEISSDDGNDIDSTPDTDPADDVQPAGPGDPTNDVIDNTDGDSDDHDPAGVTVASFDLALQKVYTSDTFGDPNDGVIENGADVTFTITVTNQGSAQAVAFEVTDYIPAGFVLNDAGWVDNGDGTATTGNGLLAPGATSNITITLTATTATPGTSANWAEISADAGGTDVDSTPDTDQTNDAQPAGPDAPTDDVIDNTPDGNGIADEDDHDVAGVSVANFDLALTKVYTSDTSGAPTDGVVAPGADVTFTITVTNQGTIDAATFEVTDFLPTGFTLNDAAWTDNGDDTATFTGGPLAAGATQDIDITLTAGTASGDFVNWAEISSDDGNDVDSTPDASQGNDAQPAGPGAPTDNETGNAPDGNGMADEDDHDPAGVEVASFDLALAKVYTSDTFASATDGIIEQGADVVFTITVTNQGTVDAATFDIVDYLPAGFDLNDAAWADNGDGTATFTGGPLAAGASTDISITTTATSVAPGSFENWAEISSDDGNDVDSTPDANQANDNQPAAAGDPTDGVIDNTPDGNGIADEDDHDVAAVSVANFDLALTKVYTSDTLGNSTDGFVENGADVTFTITVTNQGTLDATTFEVTDHLPAGFDLNDAAWADNGDGTATIAGGPLAAGASTDITITLTANGASDGDYVNWAEISSDDGNDVDSTPDADPTNDTQPAGPGAATDDVIDNTPDGNGAADEDDHDPAPISVGSFDLALQKVYTSDTFETPGDGVVENGSDVTFTITVTNQGTIDAITFEVTDYIPAGFVLNDAAWTDNGTTATISAGPVAAGASTDIEITLTATGATDGDHVNWAEISSDDGNDVDSTPDTDPADDNQPAGPGAPTDDVIDNTPDGNGVADSDDHDPAPISVGSFDLALQKVYTSDTFGAATDGVVQAGSDVTFTISVTNQGTIDATTFEVTDYIPAGFVLNDAAWTDNGDGTASIGHGLLAPGASTDLTITLTAQNPTVGSNVNLAEISNDAGNDVDSTPDATVGNDNQPAAPGAPTDDVIDNTAGDEDDHDIAGIEVVAYDLALIKVFTSDTFGDAADGVIENGADATFTITVTNQGTLDATTFTVTDYLPAGFVLNDAAWTDNGDGTASIAGGPLPAGDSADIEVTLTADAAVPGTSVNWAEISYADGTDVDSIPDADPANDSQPAGPGAPTDNETGNAPDGNGMADEDDHDPAGVQIVNYDLALQKVYTSDTHGVSNDGVIENGADVTFTITVTNQGTADAASVEITDYLPAGFVLNDAAWTDNGDGTADFATGPIPAGGTLDVTITMTADAVVPGEAVNIAEISSDDGADIDSTPDATIGNDSQPAAPGAPTDDVIDNTAGDEDDHDIAGVSVELYDLALTKVYTSDTFDAPTDGVIDTGADVVFTITVFNQGTVDATTFEVTDYLPAGFSLNDAAWTDNGDGTATIIGGPLAAGASTDITVTMTAGGVVPGTYVNWAEISADDGNDVDSTPDGDVDNDAQPSSPGDPTDGVIDNTPDGNGIADEDDHDPASVGVENFDLALIKTLTDDGFGDPADGLTENGTDVTFTVTVINQGTIDATTFDVTDTLPAGFVLNDPTWTDNGDGSATITGGPLAAGESTDIAIIATVDNAADGVSINMAEISSDDGTDIDSTPDADPTDDAQPAAPGDPTDDVTNNDAGDSDDHDIAGVTIGSFDLALAKVYTSDTSTDGNATDGRVQVGDDVVFTITVTNQGTLDATTFDVTDYIPSGLTLNDAAWTNNGDSTATITGGPLAIGESVDIAVTMTVTSTIAGELVNSAEISLADGTDIDSTPDADPADDNQPAAPGDPTDDVIDNTPDGNGIADEDDHDIAGLTVDVFDLALVKDFTSDTSVDGNATDGLIQPGDDATFTITVTNQGTVDAATFDITDYLPQGFVLNDATWVDNGNNTATISGGPLAAGASTSVTITLTAVSPGAGPLVNWAEISADDGADVDSTPNTNPNDDGTPPSEDDIDDAPLTVDAYDLALRKVYTLDTGGEPTDGIIAAGDDITFTITVFNQGTVDATNVEVTDYVPAGFDVNDDGWIEGGDGTAYMNVGAIAAGESVDVTITLRAINPTLGAQLNNAEISSDDGIDIDSTPNADVLDDGPVTDDEINNAAGDEDDHDPAPFNVVEEIIPVFDLALQKTLLNGANTGVVSVGDTATWTITIINQGEAIAENIDVIDYIPSGLNLADNAWTELAGGDAEINIAGPIAPGASTTVNITTTVVDGSDLRNVAEIESADAVDAFGSLILSNGVQLQDIDSTPDGTNSETSIDDEVNNVGGDEDDHDGAALTLAAGEIPPLAVTGTNWTLVLISWALGLFLLGAALILFGRKEEDELAYAARHRNRNG